MKYRNLGRTGVKVSPLCLGCMMFGRKTPPAASKKIMEQAFAAGINFFDTANVYGRGASEEVVGAALHELGIRDRVVLATKVHGRMADYDPNAMANTRRHIMAACEDSLRRLKTDYIDLYQIHRPDPHIPIDETLRALDDLVQAGKVRYIGTSTFATWQIVESLWVARDGGWNRFVCEQPPYHPLDRRAERELLPMARTYGVGIIPWAPLASGFFTEKYRDPHAIPADARLQPGTAQKRTEQLLSDPAYAVHRVFDALAKEHEATMSQIALAWNMAQPGVTSPIMGIRTVEQLTDNLGSLEVELGAADFERIDAAAPPLHAIVPYGDDAAWGPHPHRV